MIEYGIVGCLNMSWKLDNLQPLWGVDNLEKGSKIII